MSNLFKSKKTEKSTTEIDPRIYDSVLRNLQFAEQVAAIPYQPYTGLMVAPFTRDYMAGEAATRRIAEEGGFVPEVEAAARSAQGLMGFQPERVSAGQVGTQFGAAPIGASLARGPERVGAGAIGTTFGAAPIGAERVGAALGGGPRMVGAGRVGTTFGARDISRPGAAPTAAAASVLGRDIGAYMNPYEQQVIEAGLGDISRAEEQARGGRAARATAARAFGGSRAAIEEGIAAGEAARERNRFVAEQRAQGFREAAAMREADVGRQQQAGLANQAAAQNVMELAQRGEITNQQRDLELGRLGLTAETANVQVGLEADRANQAAVENYQRMGLTAEQANQQAALDAAGRNQQAALEAQRMGSGAQQFNVQQQQAAALANQQAVQQYMQMGLSAEQANQAATLDAQRMGSTAQQFNVQTGMDAARANQAAGMQGAQFQLGAGRQLADLGQTALQNQYGAGAAMMGLGQSQQALFQDMLNRQQEEWQRRQQYPLQQLAIRQGAVSASPMNVTNTGTVTARPSYWNMMQQMVGSDEDMKRDVRGIKNPLDKVRRLKGIEFEWENGYGEKEGEDRGGEEDMGMSAQSVERAIPEAVSRRESDNMRQYDLPQVVGLLTEAVKELDKKVGGKRRGGA
jgi:hypothetical protein